MHVHYLIIKNIKKGFIYTCSNLLSQRTPHTKTNIALIITPLSLSQPRCIRIDTQLPVTPRFLLCSHLNLYLPIQSLASFTTILFIPHKHMAYHNTIPNSATYPSHNVHHPFLLGFEPPTKFSKCGGFRGHQFLEGVAGEEGVAFSGRVTVFT